MDVESWEGVPRAISYEDYILNDDDVFYVRTSCGGGYGDPLERPLASVQRDVRNGTVSSVAARDVYGVILKTDGNLDLEATEAHRTIMRGTRQAAVNEEHQKVV